MEITNIINLIICFLVVVILGAISLTDLKTKTIPNELNLALFVLGSIYFGINFSIDSLINVSGMIICITIMTAFLYFRGNKNEEKMGMGDIKMLYAISFLISVNGLFLFIFSFSILSVFIFIVMLILKKEEIPMGEIFSIALSVSLFSDLYNILNVSNILLFSIITTLVLIGIFILIFFSINLTIKEQLELTKSKEDGILSVKPEGNINENKTQE